MVDHKLTLSVLPERFAICRLDAGSRVPSWVTESLGFFSVTHTSDEMSVVCAEESVPVDVRGDRGWRAFKLEGPLDLSITGIVATITNPLADKDIPIFGVSTYETDYVLVRESQLQASIDALSANGHTVRT